MRRRYNAGTIAIFVLLALGLISMLRFLFIPIVVLGTIFLLYKFPPSSWKKVTMYRKNDKRRKNAKFRVIDGSKRRDYDEPPRYH
jgi:hypothetical protein